MATSVGGALLASLEHRVEALESYLAGMTVPRAAGGNAQAAAIRQITTATESLRRQAQYSAGRAVTDSDAITLLSPLLAHFCEISDKVDQLSSRRVGTSPPLSLHRAIRRELRALGVASVHPLLAVGGPSSYETDVEDLWEFISNPDVIPDVKQPEYSIRLFAIPELEGTRALWTPIAVGHEVGHIAVQEKGLAGALRVEGWITSEEVEATAPNLEDTYPDSPTGRLTRMQEILTNWVVECLCDLYAAHRFGPAAIASQCDFLATIGLELEPHRSLTHPPGTTRALVMIGDDDWSGTAYEPLVDPWRIWATEGPSSSVQEPWVELLTKSLQSHRAEMVQAVRSLPTIAYDALGRQDVVRELVKWFELGVPGREKVDGVRVRHADVLNAGWIARYSPEGVPIADRAKQLDALDNLVAKTLDSIDFLRLWRRGKRRTRRSTLLARKSRKQFVDVADFAEATVPTGSTAMKGRKRDRASAVLPASEIRRRLVLGKDLAGSPNAERERLIVTPSSTLRVSNA